MRIFKKHRSSLSEDNFALAISADHEETSPYGSFQLGLHCLQK